jgi:hypothetical protein
MAATFAYLPAHGVLLCTTCHTCILPSHSSQERHLRQPPHCYKSPQLQALLDLFGTYKLQLPSDVAPPEPPGLAVQGLRRLPAFSCCLCSDYLTRSKHAVEVHVSREHGQKPAQQVEGVSWRACTV